MDSTVGYRLSPRQRHLWALLQEGGPRDARALLRLRGPLDADALHAAVHALAARHEVLRTAFERLPGMPEALQVPGESTVRREDAEDLSALAADARDARIEGLWTDRSVDGELPAARLVRTGADEHLLLLRVHALSVDEASWQHLARDLAGLYAAERGGAPVEDEPVPYLAVSEWLNDEATSDEAQQGRAYWAKQLEGGEAPLAVERDAPAEGELAAEAARRRAAPGLAAAVDAFADASGTWADDVLLAAWKALLHRLGGGAAVRVAAAFDGRADDEELQHAVGPFTEHLPVTTAVDAGLSFRALANRLHAARGYAANWQVSFDAETVRQMAGGAAAIPRLGFTLAPEAEVHAAGDVELAVDRVHVAEESFALHLRVRRGGDGMELELRGGATVPPAQLDLLLDRYETLLADALARPDAALGDLAVLSEAERTRVLADFGGAPADAASEFIPVHARIAAQAARTPDAPAVRMGAETVSFAELQTRAESGARRLRALNVGPEVRVGIMLPPSVGRVAAVLSVLRAGGAYVPLEPGYPAERLAFMIRDAGLSAVITTETLRDRVPGGVPVVAWDATDENAGDSAGAVESAVHPGSAAYVIYTSGSTGTPKGVLVEHGALEAHALAAIQHYGLGPDDRVLQFASFNFDPSIEQMLPPLMAGGCVVLRGDGVMSVEAIGAVVEEAGITLLNLPTAQWHLVADEWARGESVPDTRSLRLVIAGGEAMVPAYVDRWHATPAAGARLLNAYGPTETVVTATTFDVPADFHAVPAARAVPIGRSFGRRAAAVLDARLRPAPLGVSGELLLGGPSVARGYLGRPGLTAERFVPDPFGAVPGARLYRTGDLARQEEDGTLAFLGRVDDQVKVRGFRIEPGEVKAALERHPAVREAVVAVREDTPGEKRLAAYVVASNGTAPDVAELRTHLLASLPEYMIPGAFVAMDRLPLTPSGKVDRAALPAPEQAAAESEYAAPRNAAEALLAGIFAQVLKRDRVSIHDDFFELGGHSLLAVRMISRLREAFGAEVPLRAVLEHPTVAAMASALGALRAQTAAPALVAASAAGDEILEGVGEMSEEELDRLLSQLSADEEAGR
jgi:amino acid adenylation domain-containing protein